MDHSTYSLIRYRTPPYGQRSDTPMLYPSAGDHFTVTRLDGPGNLQIRLDSTKNPWIPIMANQAYTRRFRQLWIRDVQAYLATLAENLTILEGYVSNGPLIQSVSKTRGSKGPPFGLHALGASVVVTPLSSFLPIGYQDTIGSLYNTFMDIQNDSGAVGAANDLYFGGWNPNSALGPTTGFVLRAGASYRFEIDSMITNNFDPTQGPFDLCFWTLAGTCSFSIMLGHMSRERSNLNYNTLPANNVPPLNIETG